MWAIHKLNVKATSGKDGITAEMMDSIERYINSSMK